MAKGQKKTNREAKKPKQGKAPVSLAPSIPTARLADSQDRSKKPKR